MVLHKSGGGSALLPAVIPPLTLEDMAQVTKALSRAGATIQQLNTVRKNLELLKGGGLAATVQPAKVCIPGLVFLNYNFRWGIMKPVLVHS